MAAGFIYFYSLLPDRQCIFTFAFTELHCIFLTIFPFFNQQSFSFFSFFLLNVLLICLFNSSLWDYLLCQRDYLQEMFLHFLIYSKEIYFSSSLLNRSQRFSLLLSLLFFSLVRERNVGNCLFFFFYEAVYYFRSLTWTSNRLMNEPFNDSLSFLLW